MVRGVRNLERPFDKHIDDGELRALAPSALDPAGPKLHGISPEALRAAQRHAESCADCRRTVSEYLQFVNQLSNAVVSRAAAPGDHCPTDQDVDWAEVAAGLWPELKATQLIMHAALCDHCGPLLRAATTVNVQRTRDASLSAAATAPWGPAGKREPIPVDPLPAQVWHRVLHSKMFAPALVLLLIVGVLATRSPSSQTSLSGPKFAEFAVKNHRQYVQGSLALDVHSNSQQALNDWFKAKSQFSLALPASPSVPGEERPYRLEGARFVQVGGKTAAYIAYQMQTGLVSLMVTPESVAVASGGVELNFKKLSFHYRIVEGYRVVTWSVHGLTYALVSQEGNSTQRSCMVCHSAMRDRDLSRTPTPLRAEGNPAQPLWQ